MTHEEYFKRMHALQDEEVALFRKKRSLQSLLMACPTK